MIPYANVYGIEFEGWFSMSLYQEIPKESILTILHDRFSREELDAVRLEVNELLLKCNSMADLEVKVYEVLKTKKNLDDFRKIHEPNFFSS